MKVRKLICEMGTGGEINQHFIDYVNNNNSDLYEYFSSNSYYFANQNLDKGDLYHLAATMTGIIYESGFSDGIQFGLIIECRIKHLSGWAGDLQTAMNDAYKITNNSYNYNVFYSTIKNIIGYDPEKTNLYTNYDHSFDMDDFMQMLILIIYLHITKLP